MSSNLGYYGSAGVAAEGAYPMNSYNIEANYGPAFFDARHIFSLAGTYELPFGRDRQYRQRLEPRPRRGCRWLGARASRSRRTAGFPITVTDGSNPSLQASRSPRAAESHRRRRGGRPDARALARPQPRSGRRRCGQFGDSGVGILRAPGYWNVDISISKRFATFGRQYFLFRGELFNALNHPNFGPPEREHPEPDVRHHHEHTCGDPRIVQLVVKYYF